MYVLIIGNPGSGFEFIGPFKSEKELVEFKAELSIEDNDTAWAAQVIDPKDVPIEIEVEARDLWQAPIVDVRHGTVLIADDKFTCLEAGEELRVHQNVHGLYVNCRGVGTVGEIFEHYLDGQLGDLGENYVGFKIKEDK
jgi:hypothetical protein